MVQSDMEDTMSKVCIGAAFAFFVLALLLCVVKQAFSVEDVTTIHVLGAMAAAGACYCLAGLIP